MMKAMKDKFGHQKTKEEGIYEYTIEDGTNLKGQLCPLCKYPIGLLPGSLDAICKNCGYKDPCCE